MPHCYSIVSNMRQCGQQLQNGIILFYYVFLSPLPQISLSPLTLSHFFFLCHSLSLPSPPYSRKLLKITLQSSLSISPVLATDLAASFSTTRRRSRCLMLQPSLPTFRSLLIWLWEWDLGWVSMWVLGRRWCGFWVGIVGVRFGMGFDVGVVAVDVVAVVDWCWCYCCCRW